MLCLSPLLVVCELKGEDARVVLLFDLDAGLAGALHGLLVLATFLVFLYFSVRKDILSSRKLQPIHRAEREV